MADGWCGTTGARDGLETLGAGPPILLQVAAKRANGLGLLKSLEHLSGNYLGKEQEDQNQFYGHLVQKMFTIKTAQQLAVLLKTSKSEGISQTELTIIYQSIQHM